MQVAFDGIQYCCEALGEGKVQIETVKETVEETVGNAKAIYKEVSGLWGWLKGLFGGSPDELAGELVGHQGKHPLLFICPDHAMSHRSLIIHLSKRKSRRRHDRSIW